MVIGRLFDPDAPFWTFMGKVADVVVLNLLTVVLSVPVVTVGASLTALDEAARKSLAGTGGEAAGVYLRSWRANLRPATLLWLVVGGVGAGIAGLWIGFDQSALLVLKVLVSVMYALVFPFVWALQSRFESRVRRTLANAVLIAVARLPFAVAIVVVDALLVAVAVVAATYVPGSLVISLLLGVGLIGFVNASILDRALRPWREAAGTGSEPE